MRPCWPDRRNCRIHNHRSVGSPNGTHVPYAPPSHSHFGFSDVATRLVARNITKKVGTIVETAGYVQLASAPTSMPASSGKTWMGMTRKEARLHDPIAYADRKGKYDWQPEGTSGSARVPNRRKSKRSRRSRWDEHWSRRPSRGGKLSQPGQAAIQRHRRTQTRKGASKVAAGKALPYAGYAVYGYQILMADTPQEALHLVASDSRAYRRIHGFYGMPTDSSVTTDEWITSATGGIFDEENYRLPSLSEFVHNIVKVF